MSVQFGFMTLFAIAMPLSPVPRRPARRDAPARRAAPVGTCHLRPPSHPIRLRAARAGPQLCALVNNALEIRVDAKNFCEFHRCAGDHF
jgi:hypothetical protein